MTTDVVKLTTGTLVEMEALREALADAGVSSQIVGDELTAGFGSTLPGSIELWVKTGDVAKAKAAVAEYEKSGRKK
jgi:Putative prokaryotic signal transducing protein